MNAGRLIAILVLISWLGFAPGAPVWALPTTGEIDQLKNYCDQNPSNVKELHKLGVYYFVSKRFDEAINAWKRVLKTKNSGLNTTSKLKVYKGLALAFYKIGKRPVALKCIKLVCKHSPGDVKAERFRDRIVAELAAETQAASVKTPTPGPPTPPTVSAPPAPPKPTAAEARKAFDDGEYLYKEAKMKLEASDPAYEDKFSEAIKKFDVAVAGEYKTAKALYYLGSSRLYRDDEKDDDRTKAKNQLEKSLATENDANTLFDLGQVYGLLDMKEKEIDCFEKALALRGEGWAECHFRLALAYDKSKRVDAPRKTFENAKAAIRVKPEYKKKFQEVLKNSDVAKQIASIVSEIIEKSENDQLTDQETEKYAKKFQEMLGDKNISPDQLRDKEKMKEFLQSDKAKELMDKVGGEDKVKKLFDSPGVKRRLERELKKREGNQ